LPVILYEYEAWSVTLNKKIWLRIYQSWAIRKMFGLEKKEVYNEASFMSFTPHHIFFADEV